MKEIIDYRLLIATIAELQDEVLRFLNSKKGWQPYGNPFAAGEDECGSPYVAQAMVKYK